jgi:hypothetical protein
MCITVLQCHSIGRKHGRHAPFSQAMAALNYAHQSPAERAGERRLAPAAPVAVLTTIPVLGPPKAQDIAKTKVDRSHIVVGNVGLARTRAIRNTLSQAIKAAERRARERSKLGGQLVTKDSARRRFRHIDWDMVILMLLAIVVVVSTTVAEGARGVARRRCDFDCRDSHDRESLRPASDWIVKRELRRSCVRHASAAH